MSSRRYLYDFEKVFPTSISSHVHSHGSDDTPAPFFFSIITLPASGDNPALVKGVDLVKKNPSKEDPSSGKLTFRAIDCLDFLIRE